MLVALFTALVVIYAVRTVSLGIYFIKNKKRGAIPLFILSAVLVASPFLSALVNRFV